MSASIEEVAVRVRGLFKRYGPLVAVRNIDFEIKRGAVFGLVGPNGAGKTTTFGILCGWLRQTAGYAEVLGTASHKLYSLRGRVAVLPQDAHFPPQIAVRSQLAHFGRLMGLSGGKAKQEAGRCLELVGLSEAAGMRGNQLSHGMLKRVGLAQALLGNPDVIFLDEPTAGLDPKSARKIKSLISGLDGTTVVLSSHNLVEVQEICSHGAILNKGNLVLSGSMDVLTRRGAEITIEYAPGADLPLAALRQRFGANNVEVEGEGEGKLRIVFPTKEDVSKVIHDALVPLLDGGVPLLSVSRGTSLETAFLEVTDDSKK